MSALITFFELYFELYFYDTRRVILAIQFLCKLIIKYISLFNIKVTLNNRYIQIIDRLKFNTRH